MFYIRAANLFDPLVVVVVPCLGYSRKAERRSDHEQHERDAKDTGMLLYDLPQTCGFMRTRFKDTHGGESCKTVELIVVSFELTERLGIGITRTSALG